MNILLQAHHDRSQQNALQQIQFIILPLRNNKINCKKTHNLQKKLISSGTYQQTNTFPKTSRISFYPKDIKLICSVFPSNLIEKISMSVYSGFATRQQENKYNFLLETLVVALKKRLIKFYNQEPCDQDKFKLLIKKLYKKMYVLEKGKYMTPKYSTCFTDLIEKLSIQINYDTMSDLSSSMLSQTFSLRREKISSGKRNRDEGNKTLDDFQEDHFKSRTILQSKKNLLQAHRNNSTTMNLSAFSLKKPYFNTLNAQTTQEEKANALNIINAANMNKINRSSSVGNQNPITALKSRIKLRKLQDLKNLRGTMHMPKVQDFLPKKEQIQPSFFSRKPPIIEGVMGRQNRGGYRRQKYSRAQVNIEEI